MTRHRIGITLVAAAALALSGCAGERRETKAPGAAVWIGARSIAPDLALAERLAAQGVTEYFVEAGRLVWQSGRPSVERAGTPRLPRRERTTLVLSGDWPRADLDASAVAEQLTAEIERLRLEAEREGRLPIGVHFDVEDGWSGASLGEVLEKLRAGMDEQLYLSASVGREDLSRKGLAELVEPLDFVVAFVYGQRLGETEAAEAWDLQAVEKLIPALEALERPYLIAAATIGTATRSDRSGKVLAQATALDLDALVRLPTVELVHGFTLLGIDRQVYAFRARAPSTAGNWNLAAGDSVRVVRLATSNLEEFLRQCGAWPASRLLGPLFWRLPSADEPLSATAANIADALAPEASRPSLEILVERSAATPDGWQLRLTLVSGNDEATDLALFNSNFVDLGVEQARIVDVDPGGFWRFELTYRGDRSTMMALRAADRVRLFVPLLEGRRTLATGTVLVQPTGDDPRVRTSGEFLLTSGESLHLEQREWGFETSP